MWWNILLLSVCFLGGVIAGMGMGGGTLLIPLLTLACAFSQKNAQALNLVAFLPTAVIALIIHAKNKLIDYKSVLLIALPAIITSPIASMLALKLSSGILERSYGAFLIALGAYQLSCVVVEQIKNRLRLGAKQLDTVLFINKF